MNSSDIRSGRHCTFLLHAHLVFITKYRRNIFKKDHLKTMRSVFEKICKDFEVHLVEMEGEADHVQLLVNYPPKVAISKLVNSLKGVSSRRLRQYYPDIHQYYWKGILWSPSCFAGSCGGLLYLLLKNISRNKIHQIRGLYPLPQGKAFTP